MTDFLSVVARRAIGGPSAVRPAVPPQIPPVQEVREVAVPRRPGFVDDPTPRAARTDAATRPDEPALPEVEPMPVEPSKRRPPRSRPFRPPPTDGAAPDDGPLLQALETDASTVDVGASDRATPDELTPAQRTGHHPAAPGRPRAPAQRDVVIGAATARSGAIAASARGRNPEPIRAEAPVRPLAAVALRADDRPMGTTGPGDADDGPVVHVTIGRVEVRAAPPPAARPAPTPIAPRVTLDAYLRRRDGDGRQ